MFIRSSVFSSRSDRKVNPNRLLVRLQQCLHERPSIHDEEKRKNRIFSTVHYVDYLKRSIDENPLLGQVLFRLDQLIKNFSQDNNRFSSTLLNDHPTESHLSLFEKISLDDLHSVHSGLDHRADLSKTSLNISTSNTSTTLSTIKSPSTTTSIKKVSRPAANLLTKATQIAINKAPRQRTNRDIKVLEHLLQRCEYLRRAPIGVRRYAGSSEDVQLYFQWLRSLARSALLLTYHPNTVITLRNAPPFLVYIIVHGECRLLLETFRTTLFGRTLNVGDIYGDDAIHIATDHRIIGMITGENHHCSFITFFIRDIRAYEKYLSDQMKQAFLDRLRLQSKFFNIHWREDLVKYFLKWSTYRQYLNDEVIYGNEDEQHDQLHFILYGHVAFVRLLEFPSLLLQHPHLRRIYQVREDPNESISPEKKTAHSTIALRIIDDESIASSVDGSIRLNEYLSPSFSMDSNQQKHNGDAENNNAWSRREMNVASTCWKFIETFVLSEDHYFGFESNTRHAWYLSRNLVDLISIPKVRFQKLGLFAPMLFEKLREDFLEILPSIEHVRETYLNHLRMHRSTANETNQSRHSKKQINIDQYDADLLQKIHWIPEQTVLNQYKGSMLSSTFSSCQ